MNILIFGHQNWLIEELKVLNFTNHNILHVFTHLDKTLTKVIMNINQFSKMMNKTKRITGKQKDLSRLIDKQKGDSV